MKKALTTSLLIGLVLIPAAFGQKSGKKKDKKPDDDHWQYVGSSVFDVRREIKVDSYFNEKEIGKEGDRVRFQIMERPDKPILFAKAVFGRLYEFRPERYAVFTHLITFFEGDCRQRVLRVYGQQAWGSADPEKPLHDFRIEREFEKVRPGSSKESDLLRACR